jgi:hypothetical protein
MVTGQDNIIGHDGALPSTRENIPDVLVRGTKPVSFSVGRLRHLLRTKNVTD